LQKKRTVKRINGGTLIANGTAMALDAQHRLFEALKAHTFQLETERDAAPERDQTVFDRRLEAAQRLLEWLSTILEPASPSNSNARLRWFRTDSNLNFLFQQGW
jgi:hypothetical protein